MHQLTHEEHQGPNKGNPLAHLLAGLVIGAVVAVAVTLAVYKPATPKASQAMSSDSMMVMVDSLRDKKGDDFDRAFIEQMIPHHESAVAMAQLIAERSSHEEVKELGNEIISAQKGEINRMKAWYTAWGYGTYTKMFGMDHTTH